MFDFDDIGDDDEGAGTAGEGAAATNADSEAEADSDVEDARRLAEGLSAKEPMARWDAIRALVQLEHAACSQIPALAKLAETEEDDDVAGAARKALKQLRAWSNEPPKAKPPGRRKPKKLKPHERLGETKKAVAEHDGRPEFKPMEGDIGEYLRQLDQSLRRPAPAPRRAPASDAAVEAAESSGDEAGRPKVRFKIFKETLSMHVERGDMTPNDITALWEVYWGIEYAGRIRFEAPAGSENKFLNPREDVVPLSPAVVKLHEGVGSILYTVAAALKQYGKMAPEAAVAERERKRQQMLQRQEAEGRYQAKQRKKFFQNR